MYAPNKGLLLGTPLWHVGVHKESQAAPTRDRRAQHEEAQRGLAPSSPRTRTLPEEGHGQEKMRMDRAYRTSAPWLRHVPGSP